MTDNKLILGVDMGEGLLKISCCLNSREELKEVCIGLKDEEESWTQKRIIDEIKGFLKEQQLEEYPVEKIVFSLEQTDPKEIKRIRKMFWNAGFAGEDIYVISRENAFIHYVMHQEESIYDHTVLLFVFDGAKLSGYRLTHSKKETPKKIRVEKSEIGSFSLLGENRDWGRMFDEHFASIARQILSKEVVSAVFLTGKGFEGGWLNHSLNVLCSGRRAFIGQNLFSGGGCYYAIDRIEKKKKDCVFAAPETVLVETGIVDQKDRFIPIARAGSPWYETKGEIEIILERGNRVDIVFSNKAQGEKQVESVELTGFSNRPKKTIRVHISVQFISSQEGLILIRDVGFGQFFPGSNQVFLKKFKLL
ncbi:MAG: DUF5716 family protein [Lachnospiraceae bacterium]|nr:DUF5716 family protein [Lachnospiraceae bacterium]